MSIPGALFITDFIPDPMDETRQQFGHNKETAFYWPHIPCGLRNRCAHFKETTEEDNPQSPMSFACQHEAPTLVAEWRPWVKPSRKDKTCGTCQWFEPALCQRAYKSQPDVGTCLHDPPRPRQFHHFEPMLPRAEMGATPTVSGATGLWCSEWSGPRPPIAFSPEPVLAKPGKDTEHPGAPKSNLEAYVKWEAGRERLTWLAALQLAKVKEMQRQAQERQQKRIVTLDKIRPVE